MVTDDWVGTLLATALMTTGVVSTIPLLTVTLTTEEVPTLPEVSLATTLIVCVPFVAVVVFQVYVYGAIVTGVPTNAPSMTNWTLETPILSEAEAVSVTAAPETTVPVVGA